MNDTISRCDSPVSSPVSSPARAHSFVAAVQLAISMLFLCLPALVNRAPMVFPDTRAYFLGGHAAVEKVLALFARHTGNGGDAALQSTIQNARGVRSAFYSLFTYIPTILASTWLVILLQAVIVALLLRLTFALARPGEDGWRTTGRIILLALATTVSWATSYIMPDIFTGVMALAIILTFVYWQQLSRVTAWLLFAAIAGGVVMHMINLPVALGLLLAGCFLRRRELWRYRYAATSVAGAVVVGVAAMLVVGVVGFKQWTLAPQAPPFLTARSIVDGPGKLYLREHCPAVGLAMCRHLDTLDESNTDFLWGPDGAYSRMSPEERAQVRAEDKRLFIAAAREHLPMQLSAMLRHAATQLVLFGVNEYLIPSWAEHTADDMTIHEQSETTWHTVASVVVYLVVAAALGWMILNWRRLTPSQRQFCILAGAAVLLEAAAGGISEPTPRYEARVIWLLPLAALVSWPRTKSSRETVKIVPVEAGEVASSA